MSGPKTSRYTLTPEQRKIIEEQQRIRRETKVAQEERKRLSKRINTLLDDLTITLDEIQDLCGKSEIRISDVTSYEKQISAVRIEIDAIDRTMPTDSLDLLKVENTKQNHLLQQCYKLRDFGRQLLQQVSSEYKCKLVGDMKEGFLLSFEGLGQNRKTKGIVLIDKINDLLSKINDMDLPNGYRERFALLKQRANEINNVDFLENFISLQIYPFIRDCEFYRDHITEFDDLLSQYIYLAEETGEAQRLFVFSSENISKIKMEISRLQKILLYQKEQEYINITIDEAMREMGYELIGQRMVKKKSGKRFRNELYALEKGKAVSVTFSDDGQISMELGVIDTYDRQPSAAEAADLTEDMKAFCSDFGFLEERLLKKGIIAKHLSLLPPSVDYALVINASDYKMKTHITAYKQNKKKTIKGKYQFKEEG